MKRSEEFQQFDDAMSAILRADPKAVRDDMEREKKHNAEKRKQRTKRNDSPKVDSNRSR